MLFSQTALASPVLALVPCCPPQVDHAPRPAPAARVQLLVPEVRLLQDLLHQLQEHFLHTLGALGGGLCQQGP